MYTQPERSESNEGNEDLSTFNGSSSAWIYAGDNKNVIENFISYAPVTPPHLWHRHLARDYQPLSSRHNYGGSRVFLSTLESHHKLNGQEMLRYLMFLREGDSIMRLSGPFKQMKR